MSDTAKSLISNSNFADGRSGCRWLATKIKGFPAVLTPCAHDFDGRIASKSLI